MRYFITIISLLYVYIIKQRISEGVKMLKLKNIYFHWRFNKEDDNEKNNNNNCDDYNENNNNNIIAKRELLYVNKFIIIKPFNRSSKIRNKKRN